MSRSSFADLSVNATLPPGEPARLAALRRYQILDTPPDGAFDDLTAVAAALFKVPIAIVSLVDHDRIWFKSHHGLDASQAAMDQLTSYAWPGNVRELQNAVERAVILAQGGALQFDWLKCADPLPAAAAAPAAPPAVLTNAELKERERRNLMAALAQTGGKIFGPTGTAALLGMKPTTVISRLKAFGLKRNKPSRKRG